MTVLLAGLDVTDVYLLPTQCTRPHLSVGSARHKSAVYTRLLPSTLPLPPPPIAFTI